MSSREQAIQQARKTVEQLRGERNMRRTPVSASAADLIRFTQDLQREDVLLTGFPNDKMNPYRPKTGGKPMNMEMEQFESPIMLFKQDERAYFGELSNL
ncbi:hypothetical protein RB195_010544 [Necator americanus]|uniref:Guanine nucleotide-binding protein subunit gamma n=1 Tax=Necator americanus TaxID=51031 RepID=A0ABR1CYE9_NECAM